MFEKFFLVFVGAISLSGCVVVGPDASRIEADLAEKFVADPHLSLF